MSKPRALIAMSGGVDSSVAVLFMQAAGYECQGATMDLFHPQEVGQTSGGSLKDVEDARSVARRLGIPHFVFDFTDDFRRQVINRFVSAYESGETPNPCVDCNRNLKFGQFYRRAMELGCDCVVTGHYARITQENGRWLLKKAVNPSKDQSYVLYSLTQEELAHTRFPLGEYTKAEIRQIAEEHGLVNAHKHDSQDICFVPDGDYVRMIEAYTGKVYPPGDFVSLDGTVLGQHKGIIRYTIGQRKGLGLSLPEPMYVCAKNMADNTVVLGRNSDLFTRDLDARNVNWIAWDTPPETFRAKARVRYQQKEQWATITPTGEASFHLVFDEPQRAITAGQAVVLYDGDTVIGGGTIQGQNPSQNRSNTL